MIRLLLCPLGLPLSLPLCVGGCPAEPSAQSWVARRLSIPTPCSPLGTAAGHLSVSVGDSLPRKESSDGNVCRTGRRVKRTAVCVVDERRSFGAGWRTRIRKHWRLRCAVGVTNSPRWDWKLVRSRRGWRGALQKAAQGSAGTRMPKPKIKQRRSVCLRWRGTTASLDKAVETPNAACAQRTAADGRRRPIAGRPWSAGCPGSTQFLSGGRDR
jgi:hypothetical protein